MRVSCVSLIAYAPVASTPSTCLGIPSPAGGAPALITFLGEPRFPLQGGPSSALGKRDRMLAPAMRIPQPQHGQESPGNSCRQVDREKRVPLDKRTRGTKTGQRKDGPAAGSPRMEGFLSPGIQGSWHKATPHMGHIQDTPMTVEKREMPFLEQQGGEILEKAVFRKKEEKQ